MPIGRTSTSILLKINKPKHTRISQQQEHKSLWWKILEMMGVQVIAVELGLGASDFIGNW